MPGPEIPAALTESLTSSKSSSPKPSYWAHMVSRYEKRNASLEQRQTELAERIRLMECAVPSLLMGAMVSMKRNPDSISSKLSSSSRAGEQTSNNYYQSNGASVSESSKGINVRPEVNRFSKNTGFRP